MPSTKNLGPWEAGAPLRDRSTQPGGFLGARVHPRTKTKLKSGRREPPQAGVPLGARAPLCQTALQSKETVEAQAVQIDFITASGNLPRPQKTACARDISPARTRAGWGTKPKREARHSQPVIFHKHHARGVGRVASGQEALQVPAQVQSGDSCLGLLPELARRPPEVEAQVRRGVPPLV